MMELLPRINATVFYSYQVCPREAWLYFHRLTSDKENPFLILGRLIHEQSYKRERKEIFVDQLLKIDLFQDNLVAEVKKSSKHEEAAELQLCYYLYYLKHEKGLEFEGVLLFPKERKRKRVVLTPEKESTIEELLRKMQAVLLADKPPPPKKTKFCRSCAFRDFCWAEEQEGEMQ